MKSDGPKDIDRLFEEGDAIDAAIAQAVQETVERHAREGLPVVIWQDGQIVWVDAQDLLDDAEWAR